MDRVGASEVSDTLKLYLIRHGETAWSLTGQHTSRTDIALTQHGEQQSRELEPWLRRIAFVRVLTSAALRAKQTCELAAAGCEAEIEPELSEWDYGDYEDKRTSDIRQERPHWNIWRDGCPHGETPANVCDRADRLLARLRILRGNIALFSHGQFGSALGARWVEIPLSAGQHFVLRPASLCVLTNEPAHPRVPVIALWNATPGFL
jgi:probable phosphoglycerate mutase